MQDTQAHDMHSKSALHILLQTTVLSPFPRYRTLLGVFHPEPGQVAFVLWFPRRAVALVASETRSSQPEWLRKVPAFESVPGC